MEKLKVDLVSDKPCAVTLCVEIPLENVKSETSKVFDEIQKSASVPGFRAGKAPMDMIKKNFISSAKQKVVENLIQNSVFKALSDKKIEPVSYPKVENIDFDFEKPFTFKFTAERHPEVVAKDYKGIKIKNEAVIVDEAKVKDSIAALQERNAKLEESKSETITDKNFLMVDYEASIDGRIIPEMQSKNQMIDMSSPQTIVGFKEGLQGAKKGESKEIKVKFPAEHPNKNIAGQDAIFKVLIKEVKEKVLPDMDDEFAKDLGLKDLAELQSKVKESMELEEKRRQEHDVQTQIIDSLVKTNEFSVPDSMVEEQTNYLLSKAGDYFKQQGMPEASWKPNVEKLREKYKEQAVKDVRLSYILSSVAEQEKILITEDDLKKEYETMIQNNAGREKEVEKYYDGNKDKIAAHLKEERIFKFLLDKAKVK